MKVLWVSGFFLTLSLSLTFSSSSLVSQSAALTLGWQKLDTSTEEWSFSALVENCLEVGGNLPFEKCILKQE